MMRWVLAAQKAVATEGVKEVVVVDDGNVDANAVIAKEEQAETATN